MFSRASHSCAESAAAFLLAPDRSPGPFARLGHRLLARRLGGAWLALFAALGVGLVTRGALLAWSASEVTWDLSLVRAFAWGSLFDLGAACVWIAALALLLAALPAGAFSSRLQRGITYGAIFAIVLALLLGAAAELVFWDEFGARFNFIAVDYLVYTTEVIGNIRESYPISAILGALVGLALLGVMALHRSGVLTIWLTHPRETALARWRGATWWVVAAIVLTISLEQNRLAGFANTYNAELAKDGLWSFVAAFRSNQLDFEAFYPKLPPKAAFARMHDILTAAETPGATRSAATAPDLLRPITHPGPELRFNVIQITVESLSAEFLARYGNTQGLTPVLDGLIPQALVFDQFYATGNRTDRGMEALTLSVPPTPGRSLVKRPDNGGLFTLGSVFRRKGYATMFMYGGYGYFDNMNAFFGGNGYRIVDRTKVSSDDITFANAWGACDEDLFRWTLREADREFAADRPFYQFVMTTSNHRPFTYPAGRIDLPPKVSGRAGGVKYTDFAIGEFLRAAATRPWFDHTVFVIVADHCASSAGKTELPVQNYHIPLIIYAPGGQVTPGAVTTLASQIDYGPTLLGLLGWSYSSRFYGRDIQALRAGVPGRALLGNYQKLGLYQDGKLAVLQPVRRCSTYRYDERTATLISAPSDPELIAESIGYYETASWLFKHHVQREVAGETLAN